MADLSSLLDSAGIGGDWEGRRSTFGAPRRGGEMDCSGSRLRPADLRLAGAFDPGVSPVGCCESPRAPR
jgi:hypothetical protein